MGKWLFLSPPMGTLQHLPETPTKHIQATAVDQVNAFCQRKWVEVQSLRFLLAKKTTANLR